MKARIKATGEIVDVHECVDDMYLEKIGDMSGRVFHIQELDFDNLDYPDYWTRLEHTYAGMAMQGMMAGNFYQGLSHDRVVESAQYIAHALVQKLKEKEERK